MGRRAKYTEQDILDAALELVAEDGTHAASVVAIAKRLGAPSGSIYHRFSSRDLILATLWIRTVKRFQQGFLEALTLHDTVQAARGAVEHIVTWTSAHRSEARILTMYRREDLITAWPDELGADLSSLNDEVTQAVIEFTRRHFNVVDAETTSKARFALIEIPYAAARHIIRNPQPPPSWLSQTVVAASLASLSTGRAES